MMRFAVAAGAILFADWIVLAAGRLNIESSRYTQADAVRQAPVLQ